MNSFVRSTYTRTIIASLFLHGVLIGIISISGFFGSAGQLDQPNETTTTVEVDFVPARVVEMGEMDLNSNDPPPPTPITNTVSRPAQQAGPCDDPLPSVSPALPGESGATSVAQFVSSAPSGDVTAISMGTGTTNGSQGEEVGDGNRGETGANCLYAPKPAYPYTARKAGWEGVVVLRVLIDSDGAVASVTVRNGSGYDLLDSAAAQVVKKWRFLPAKRGGVPVVSFHDIKVRFRLVDTQ
ncbi:MAG: hypothetical protein H6Q67_1236 [Firmicutes bacterium]|nr:hypothetical protein [Bacillota bacterium]